MPWLFPCVAGVITQWNDPAIVALNPALAQQGKLPATNISTVVATTGPRFEQKYLIQRLYYSGGSAADNSTTVVGAFTRLPTFLPTLLRRWSYVVRAGRRCDADLHRSGFVQEQNLRQARSAAAVAGLLCSLTAFYSILG